MTNLRGERVAATGHFGGQRCLACGRSVDSIGRPRDRVESFVGRVGLLRMRMMRISNSPAGAGFNPHYTFSNFVPHPRDAGAIFSGATDFSRYRHHPFNPSFIFGEHGVGKTHLLHAVGRGLHDRFPDLRILHCTSEQFVNSCIHAFRLSRIRTFRRFLHQADILVIDDLQFLIGKTRSMMEGVRLIRYFVRHRRPVALASHGWVDDIAPIYDKLYPRYQHCAGIERVTPPGSTMRLRILEHLTKRHRVRVPFSVLRYLAGRRDRSGLNVRALEGSFLCLVAYTKLVSRGRMDVRTARAVLSDRSIG